jgi:ferredoxin
VLPVEVEELGSVGLDAWLAALAWGAASIRLLATPGVAPSVRGEVEFQIRVAQAVLEGLGYSADQLSIITAADVVTSTLVANDYKYAAAEFAAVDEKRTLIRLAVDHLASQAQHVPAEIELPAGAPFGEISIDAGRCTLCMACVSQCPANALSAGDDSPQVRFVEARCVQCGLCANSCPETAISLSARFVTDANQRNLMRTLHEDEPFCCIRCQKPFATHSIIARITEKMKHHPMFSGDALDRLKMCEDCRVKDMYETGNDASPEIHPGGHA